MINPNDYPLFFTMISDPDKKELRAQRHGSWAYTFIEETSEGIWEKVETLSTYKAMKKYQSDKRNKTSRIVMNLKKGNVA